MTRRDLRITIEVGVIVLAMFAVGVPLVLLIDWIARLIFGCC